MPMYDFQKWLAGRAERAPGDALKAVETPIQSRAERALQIWDDDMYSRMLTRLSREDEEREDPGNGAFLATVIKLQDALIQVGDHRFNEWLNEAERSLPTGTSRSVHSDVTGWTRQEVCHHPVERQENCDDSFDARIPVPRASRTQL